MPTPRQSFPILWSVRHGRAAIYPIHSSLGGHSSIPLFRGWPRAALPGVTLLQDCHQGCRREGIGEEVPNTDQSVQQNLKEQSRDSMVLEPYYRNAEEREKVERRKRERGREGEEREEEDKEKGKRREK